MRNRNSVLLIGVALFTALAGLQILSSWLAAREVAAVVTELPLAPGAALDEAKTAEDVIAARIERRKQGLFWHQLNTGLGPLVSILGALLGGLVAWRSYLDTRNKERVGRGATELKEVLELLVSDEERKQVVGAVSLQHFLIPTNLEHHRRALVALAAAARFKDAGPEVLRGLRLAAEMAFREVPREVLAEVSWQGVRLPELRTPGPSLRGLDFTDADLERADFSGCDLTGAQFRNTSAKGARFERATLDGVDFAYADLAGASLREASLAGAVLDHARIADLDLDGANLESARFDVDLLPFDRTRNWRRARLAPAARRSLEEKFGAQPTGPRVVMLLWEFPPYVAGGTWTAAYHFVRVLRRSGANLTVVVPWAAANRTTGAFGTDVEVVNLGLTPPDSPPSRAAGGAGAAAYGAGWSSYGRQDTSLYGSSYSGSYDRGGPAPASAIMRLREEFVRRLLDEPRVRTAQIIHAHDWITFDAGHSLASRLGVPWIAHFHSLESDRRAGAETDAVLALIEARAVRNARALVTPSRVTATRLVADYGARLESIVVIPNPLSVEPPVKPEATGRFETRRVVFTGRLTAQKGPDRLLALAEHSSYPIVIFGAGELATLFVDRPRFKLAGALPWHERGRAFEGASAIVVPSRAEPFGMVVLEALQHRVPVLYPADSGVAEVISAGRPIDPENVAAWTAQLDELLSDWPTWERVVEEQSAAYTAYVASSGPAASAALATLWSSLVAVAAKA